MKINICFLIISKKDKSTPLLACINENDKKFVPNYSFEESDYPDLFQFARNKFKDLSGLNAIDITGKGWVYLHICGSLVKNNELYIVYGVFIPETMVIKDTEWVSIFDLMQNDMMDVDVLPQLAYCFNAISR